MTYDSEDDPFEWLLENDNALLMMTRMDKDEGNIKAELNEKADLTGKPTRDILEAAQDVGWIEQTERSEKDFGRANRYELTSKGRTVQMLLGHTDIEEGYREFIAEKTGFEKQMEIIRGFLREELSRRGQPEKGERPIAKDAEREAGSDETPLSESEIQDRMLEGTGAFEPDSIPEERKSSSSDDEDE